MSLCPIKQLLNQEAVCHAILPRVTQVAGDGEKKLARREKEEEKRERGRGLTGTVEEKKSEFPTD